MQQTPQLLETEVYDEWIEKESVLPRPLSYYNFLFLFTAGLQGRMGDGILHCSRQPLSHIFGNTWCYFL